MGHTSSLSLSLYKQNKTKTWDSWNEETKKKRKEEEAPAMCMSTTSPHHPMGV